MDKSKKGTPAPITGLMGKILSKEHQTVEDLLKEGDSSKKNKVSTDKKKISFPEQSVSELERKVLNTPYTLTKLPLSEISRWKLANRLHLNEKSCESLIESIKNHGQQQPVIVRKNNKKYELISGSRRLFACQQLKIDVLALVVELTDKEALVLMDLENRERQDISPYERALDYKRWVEEGVYKNYAQIVEAIGIKKNLLSQIVSLSDLDPTLANSFNTPFAISIKWGYALKKFIDKNPSLLSKAIELAKKGLDSKAVLREITSVDKKTTAKITTLKNHKGDVAVKVKKAKSGETVLTFTKTVEESKIIKLIDWLKDEL